MGFAGIWKRIKQIGSKALKVTDWLNEFYKKNGQKLNDIVKVIVPKYSDTIKQVLDKTSDVYGKFRNKSTTKTLSKRSSSETNADVTSGLGDGEYENVFDKTIN